MFQATHLSKSDARRGVILMVVLALLTLFAIVGLSFVLYADSSAKSSEVVRQSETSSRADVDPEHLLSYFLGQLIYDTDDKTGIYSAMRGHSLARNMYGLNYDAEADNSILLPNNVPFNGTGRLHTVAGAPPRLGTYNNPFNIDDYFLINYTFFRNDDPRFVFLRDPERLGALKLPARNYLPYRTDPNDPTVVPGPYRGGFNAPYTYPDLNNMFLAAVKAGPLLDSMNRQIAPPGTVLMPSFHRPWLFGPLTNRGNPNWSNVEGKYLTLRPRPIDMDPNKFPYPEDEGGDVKNLTGSPGYFDPSTGKLSNNDSIWMDLGFPVMVAPNGSKFKPLFAPLIIDLDNRVNMNVHGNIRAYDSAKNRWLHLSNQGLGPWEVNLGRILNIRDPLDPTDDDPLNPKEWTKLFTGRAEPDQPGRYGTNSPDNVPIPHSALPGNQAPAMTLPPFYSKLAFDASNDTWPAMAPAPTGISGPVKLPLPDNTTFSCFPTYQVGYSSGPQERLNHPLLYNVFQPTPNDRGFALSNLEALLRYRETGSSALTSDLFRSCPLNFSSDKVRGLLTTRSFDYDRPGAIPWARPYQSSPYQLTTGDFPTGSPIPYDAAQASSGEYGPDGRSLTAALGRIDLNRPLPPYPQPGPDGRIPNSNLNEFRIAQDARVQLARDIYDRLRLVTTGDVTEPPAARPGSAEFNALRWLAQLAVNIVDYIDSDDYVTPFNWYTEPTNTRHWVFGTELPRAILNEVYSEIVNGPGDSGQTASVPYHVNFWVELHNPLFEDSPRGDNGRATLQLDPGQAGAVYQLIIAQAQTGDRTNVDPANVLGDPLAESVKTKVEDFSRTPAQAREEIMPTDGSYSGVPGTNQKGFYVLGPSDADLPGTAGNFVTLKVKDQQAATIPTSHGMWYTAEVGEDASITGRTHNLFLRRLACPHLPFNPDQVSPQYNPYITIDYVERVPLNDARQKTRTQANNPNFKTPDNRYSYGRKQPYAAAGLFRQTAPAVEGQPHHTFFRHNGEQNPFQLPSTSLKYPFDWLIHADRPLISPMELLNVSMFKPHLLTQQFITYTAIQPIQEFRFFQHRAGRAFSDERTRIYRVFEFLETRGRAMGSSTGGRVPGKININTIWDAETLAALCDPQSSNNFGPAFDVNRLFKNISESRAPGDGPTTPPGMFSKKDRPFRGMATPFSAPAANENLSPESSGIKDTLLRPDSSGRQPLFSVPVQDPNTANPFLKDELITKIFNNVTTRSNVFAVWLTVGFFEVVQDTDAAGNPVRPVKLGAEIGRAENRHTRHRMFAIVDRTNIRHRIETPVFISATSAAEVPPPYPNPNPQDVIIKVDALSGSYEGIPWAIRQGSELLVDVGIDDPENATLPHQEVVTVIRVDNLNNTFTAKFKYPHRNGFLINLAGGRTPPPPYSRPGNPGPQPGYDPRQDTPVVRYLSIIE